MTASAILWAIWGAGVLLCLLPVLAGTWHLRALRRSELVVRPRRRVVAQAVSRGGTASVYCRADARIDSRSDDIRHASASRSCCRSTPTAWSDDELSRAMIHELEHVRRGDWLSQYMARIVRALYWFHPLVWIAWRRLSLEAERACDDAVLRRSEATAYASQLVLLAERLATHCHTAAAGHGGLPRSEHSRPRGSGRGTGARSRGSTTRGHGYRRGCTVHCRRGAAACRASGTGTFGRRAATAAGLRDRIGETQQVRRGGAVHTDRPSWRQSHGGEHAAATTDHIRLSDPEFPARGRARLDRFRSLRHPRQVRA